MILSRYPLLNQQRKILVRPKGLRAKIFHGEGLVRKSVYVAQIETPSGRLVSVANTHLVANYCSETRPTDCVRYDRVRESQFRQASEFLLQWSKGTPMVFGGDFNFGPHVISADPSWNQLDEILPGFRQADFDPTADQTSSSSNSFNESSMGKIDHLFVSPELSLVHGAVVFAQKVISRHNGKEMNLSDHYGWETTVVVD
jgi:endonuclease/exonuclease/phosphatase family metal-dependent hydrolase